MTESIALHSFCTNSQSENDIEEYHEIEEATKRSRYKCLQKYNKPNISDDNFFTQYNNDLSHEESGKKKKAKNKETTRNLMEIISSELADLAIPVTAGLVTTSEQHTEMKNMLKYNLFRRPVVLNHTEDGYGDKLLTATLSPVYSKVLENTVTEYHAIPVQYVEPAMINAVKYESKSEQKTKFLDLTIKNLKFKHHHDFSIEELLCNKLIEIYKEYEDVQKLLRQLGNDIKVLRETKDSLKDDIQEISQNKESIRFDETIRKYTYRFLHLNDKYLETVNLKKQLMHTIVSLWRDIEMVREINKSVRTPYVLVTAKTTIDPEEFEKEWTNVFNAEFTDILDKLEYNYVTQYIEYKKCKAEKTEHTKIMKPKLEIDKEKIKEEAEALTNLKVTRESIDLFLKVDEKLKTDLSRHKLIKSKQYYFKIYVDDLFVCESETYESKTGINIDAEFTESFSIQIVPQNLSMNIVLCEQGETVSYLKLDLTHIKNSNINANFTKVKFVYNTLVEPNSKYVGCGHSIKEIAAINKIRLRSGNLFKGNLYTSCETDVMLGWDDKLNQNESEIIKYSIETGKQLKRITNGMIKPNADVLKEIIINIYERDITNDEEMLNTCKRVCKLYPENNGTVLIDEKNTELIRLKLLHLRNNGGFSNVEDKMIPLLASQISTEQLNCLQITSENDVELYFNKQGCMDTIELQRYISVKYVQKLNKNMLKNLSEFLLKKTHKDVVRDFKDLSLRSFLTTQPNLSLSTLSASSKRQMLTESLNKEHELTITVFRAFALPDRTSLVLDIEDHDEKVAGFKVRPLRPYVRVTYNKTSAQTPTAIGCHPSWNHSMKIKSKFEPISTIQIAIYDEQKESIGEGSDDASFYENTVHYRCQSKWLGSLQIPIKTVLDMGTIKGTFKIARPPILLGYETPQNKGSNHSLIPAVKQLMRKEASFVSLQISSSLSHLGGQLAYNQPVPSDPDDYIIHHLNAFVTDYIADFPSRNISLTFIDSCGTNKCVTHFLQPIPTPDMEYFSKNLKSGSAMSKSSGKSSSSKSSGRKREIDVERGGGEEKESIYSAFSDWRGESQFGRMIECCVRYVSLIPTYEMYDTHAVTLLGVELLQVLYGSPLDHTLLLASYFLYLGIKTYIAIGLGLPRGSSSYVLTKYDLKNHRVVLSGDQESKTGWFSKSDWFVWHVYDAVSGERSELRDVSCPLKSVDFVFDNENIWVNMQTSVDCESVSFDFTKPSDWQLVFDKSIFIMKLPIITDSSLYSAPMNVDNLRQELELKIKSKVQTWRPHVKTIWNRYFSSLLRDILPYWECFAFNPTEQKPGLGQRLKQLMVTHKMFGFPLNMPYVNTKSVLSTVKATSVHLSDDPNSEFGLGVEVYAYPNNVISVWVFIASITRI